MPEGPECHTIANRLEQWIKGRNITGIEAVAGRYKTRGIPGQHLLETAIRAQCAEVGQVGAHGKMIYLRLPRANLVIISTLGLSGKWSNKRTAHCDVRVETDEGKVWFKDQLHYGTLVVVGQEAFERRLRRLGPDVTLGASISEEWWRLFVERKGDKSVAEVLMNQSWIAGIGNYLKAEIMYAAEIAPLSRLDDLPKRVVARLLECINTIPHAWYMAKVGRGPRQKMKVYGRRKAPGGAPVVRTKTPDARITHWDQTVQVEYTAH